MVNHPTHHPTSLSFTHHHYHHHHRHKNNSTALLISVNSRYPNRPHQYLSQHIPINIQQHIYSISPNQKWYPNPPKNGTPTLPPAHQLQLFMHNLACPLLSISSQYPSQPPLTFVILSLQLPFISPARLLSLCYNTTIIPPYLSPHTFTRLH